MHRGLHDAVSADEAGDCLPSARHANGEGMHASKTAMTLLQKCCPGHSFDIDKPLREQGLSSLAAARFLLDLKIGFGLEFKISDFLGGLTLRGVNDLVERIDLPMPTGGGLDRPSYDIAMLPLQQAFLVTSHEGVSVDPVGCHIYREYEVVGFLPSAIEEAWAKLCMLQPMLCAVVSTAGRYVFGGVPPVHIEVVDDDQHDEVLLALRTAWSFRVNRGPADLIRVGVVVCARVSTIVFSADGLIIDGQGLAQLVSQWSELLLSPDGLFASPRLDYSEAVKLLFEQDESQDQVYWRGRLRDLPAPLFSRSELSRPVNSHRQPWQRRVLNRTFEQDRWQKYQDYARTHGISPTSLVFGAFCLALLQYERRDDAAVILTTTRRIDLPDGGGDLIGSFTSNLLFPVCLRVGESLADFLRRLNDELWQDISHSNVSAMSAVRLAGHGSISAFSRVAFTSMLGIGTNQANQAGKVLREVWQASQTAGVALEHQMEEVNGGLVITWTVADAELPEFAADLCFVRMLGVLDGLIGSQSEGPALNALQKSYWVQRNAVNPEPGCNAVFSFEVSKLDFDLLAKSWSDLQAEMAALRRVALHDGSVGELADHSSEARATLLYANEQQFEERRSVLDQSLARQGFQIGIRPSATCFALLKPDGNGSVHCAFDLMFLDGQSIHGIVARLAVALARQDYVPALGQVDQYLPKPIDAEYWQAKAADMPEGPPALKGTDEWLRIEDRLSGFAGFAAACAEHELKPTVLCAAAFVEAWRAELKAKFTIPFVWWGASSQPGEHSNMSWFSASPRTDGEDAGSAKEVLSSLAKSIDANRSSDLDHGSLRGLAHIARRFRSGTNELALPVVFTQLVVWLEIPEEAAQSLRWVTRTPGIALDAVSLVVNDELRLAFDYRVGCFPEMQIDRVHGRTIALLRSWFGGQQVSAAEDKSSSGRAITDARPVVWAHGSDVAIGPDLFQLRFEASVRDHGDAIAVISASHSISYYSLNRYANRIANELRRRGILDGHKVGIAIRRGIDMAAAVVGVLKAGGAYVPLDPGQPTDRAIRMMGIGEVSHVLTTASTELLFDLGSRELINIDQLVECDDDSNNPEIINAPTSLAYVIFTSGSTGEPKGVEVQHLALQNLIDWAQRRFGFDSRDRGLCVTPLGFDLSVFDILGLLSYGASVYIADEIELRDPAVLYDVMLSQDITFWNSAPKMFEQMQDIFLSDADRCNALRLAFCSGDYMSLGFPAKFHRGFPGAQLINLGGATEATVWSNFFEVTAVEKHWRSIPYGKPIDNASYYILDDTFAPCCVGVEGDLFIAGAVLARGYCNRPDLTLQRFVPDPFHPNSGRRMYATGDRALFREDGVIVFCGRLDGQVKVRGVRIEVEEVEHALRCHEDIAEAIVTVECDPSGEAKLVAHVLGGASLTSAHVLAFAKTKLPLSMCPSRINLITKLPMTPNGKVDRKLLSAPQANTALSAASEVNFELRDEIADLIAGLVGYPIDLDADLWEQGVTSFTMVQLGNALRAARGLSLKVEWLLEAPSVNGLAEALHRHLAPAKSEPIASQIAPEIGAVACSATPRERAGQNERIDLFDLAAKTAFLDSGANLRGDLRHAEKIDFSSKPLPQSWLDRRASARDFSNRTIDAAELRRLLGPLARQHADSASRYFYPSAGGTYAVQVCLWVKATAVRDLAGGYYWFNQHDATLHRIGSDTEWGVTSHFVYNRGLFEACAAAIVLVAETSGIAPLYGDSALSLQLLEAGYMSQLLMLAQSTASLGLCPIGSFNDEQVQVGLRLSPSQKILHTLLIGALPAERGLGTPLLELFGQGDPALAKVSKFSNQIVGHSFRYARADQPKTLHDLLANGHSAVDHAPPRVRSANGGAVFGAFLEGIDTFDPVPFGIAPSDARLIDPQARLLLELVMECLGRAGHDSRSLEQGTERTGVFVGQMWQDFRLVGADSNMTGGAAVAGAGSELANRISQVFGFTGPSLAIDSACTSSIAAIHLACLAMRAGDCHSAIVCGVNLLTHDSHLRTLESLGFLAHEISDGMHDAKTQGWAIGEGAGVILLRRSDAAGADADQVLACVEASHLEHSGNRSRYGVPNAATIAQGLRSVLAEAGLRAEDIAYVECAASGAAMTDAAEWAALQEVFPDGVAVGSVKPNLGHLEAASGMSQLSKVLLQAELGKFLPTMVAAEQSPLLSGSGSLNIVGKSSVIAPSPIARFLINSVGSTSGTAHLILSKSAAVSTDPRELALPITSEPPALLLSAASPNQLCDLAELYTSALSGFEQSDWAAICATSQLSRISFSYRLAIIAKGPSDAQAKLRSKTLAENISRCDASRLGEDSTATTWEAAITEWLSGCRVDWSRFWSTHPGRRQLPVYVFDRKPCGLDAVPAPIELPGAVQEGQDERWLGPAMQAFAWASGIEQSEIEPDRPLRDYGLSSRISALMIKMLRERHPKAILSPLVLFEHPTLRGVAREFGLANPRLTTEPDSLSDQDVHGLAIIGYDGQFPGCENVDALWRELVSGTDILASNARPVSAAQPGAELMTGGFLDGDVVAAFDPLLFGIAPNVAARMDPQERLLLMRVWHALEHAGYPPHRIREEFDGRVGVYVACMHNEYPFVGLDCSSDQHWRDAGGTPAGLANRISYHFDLNGPSLTLDTMCSSSLTALKLAADDLRSGQVELAIVAASNLSLHPNKFVQQRRMGMTSPSGRCRSFSAEADGFVPSEGVVALILRCASAAVRSRDSIRALVRGVAINHGGKSNGYTVPNPEAQAAIIEAAVRDANVPGDTISYIETHGTGTVLGDPIEAKGIIKAFRLDSNSHRLAIGSLKSNIGHLEAAAGLAGLIKIVEQMRWRHLVPSIHAKNLNVDVDWDRLTLVQSFQPWEPRLDSGRPVWRAGISSFGAGGSNAHAILEAWDCAPLTDTPQLCDSQPQLLVLSAATSEALIGYARQLLDWWQQEPGATEKIADVCATLQIAREPLTERWATVVMTTEEAHRALAEFVAGRDAGFRGRAAGVKPAVEVVEDAAACLRNWVVGHQVSWKARSADAWRMVDLPRYQFDEITCWIDENVPGVALDAPVKPSKNESPQVAHIAREPMQLLERVWRPREQVIAVLEHDFPSRIAIVGPEREGLELADRLQKLLPDAEISGSAASGEADCLIFLTPSKAMGQSWQDRYRCAANRLQRNPLARLKLVQIASSNLAEDAKLAGLLTCLTHEHPSASFSWIDPGEVTHGADWAAQKILACLRAGWIGETSATQLGDMVPGWELLKSRSDPWIPRSDALYLITGGTRGLGAQLAEQLILRGARHLVLLGQNPSEASTALEAKLRRLGASIQTSFGQLGDADTLIANLAPLLETAPSLAGIFHCAGRHSASRGRLADLDVSASAATFAPKVDGLNTLQSLVRSHRPEFVLAFSSLSGCVSSLGLGVGDYAAANLAMDLMAERLRRDAGVPVTTIAWPVWASSSADAAARSIMARHGLSELRNMDAFDFLWTAMSTPSSGRLAISTARLLLQAPAERKTAEATESCTAVSVAAAKIRELVAAITGLQVDQIHNDAEFVTLGIESLALGHLTEALEKQFRLPLNPATLLEHSTVARLADVLAGFQRSQLVNVPSVASIPPVATLGKVAVIGLGLRFPGANNWAEFAKLLADGECAIGDVPEARWNVGGLYDSGGGAGKSISRWGGFIPDIDCFDTDFFGISDDAARHLDPSIRLSLEVANACVLDAGMQVADLHRRTAVFIGARMGDYRLRAGEAHAAAGLGHDQNFIAAYLAQFLNVRGPNMVVDTACSSALVAVHLACQSILSGESSMALAGGVDTLLDESVYVQFTRARALSRSGKCRTFSETADGFVPGEGAGLVLLKRLDSAVADGDCIHAVIEGTAVNNDGTTMGLTTPNPEAHRDVILEALAKAGRNADEVGLVEAHGTATRIGDPIEFRAFSQAFRTHTDRTGYCAIGSVKSNIGHLMSAAGIAGLAKAILAVGSDDLPATLFCDDPDPRLSLRDSPFFIPGSGSHWPANRDRVAGVSAVGLGGTNCHAIIAQPPEHQPQRDRQKPAVMNKRRLWLDRPAATQVIEIETRPVKKSLLDLTFLN